MFLEKYFIAIAEIKPDASKIVDIMTDVALIAAIILKAIKEIDVIFAVLCFLTFKLMLKTFFKKKIHWIPLSLESGGKCV
ncbi:MAG: hypothetical protein KR126chlam4_00363 [Candidatus Anoxychlamydiales bacterium]|nr:hypothetical protein [Candidatus Anoxychlamydiales bacterium]